MELITLTATKRAALGKKVEQVRKQHKLPAVLYGHNLQSTPIQLDEKDFLKTFKKAGESTLVNLVVDGKSQPVLIHDVHYHYLKDNPIHVDFYAVSMTEKLKAHIPLHFIGEAPAVKSLGGVLVKNFSEIEVECLPADLPHAIEVDISGLETFENVIRISDLKVSNKVKILARTEEMVINVAPPRSEAELEELKEKPVEVDVTKVKGVAEPAPSEAPAGEEKEKKEEPKETKKEKTKE